MDIEHEEVDPMKDYENIVQQALSSNGPIDRNLTQKIEKLIADLDKEDDPIIKANCLQLIADLGGSSQTLTFLENMNVPKKLISILNQDDPLIIPHALKLFYHLSPSYLEHKCPEVLQILCQFCDSDNRQLYDYAIDLIAAISRSGPDGVKLLHKLPDFRSKCLRQLGYSMTNSDSIIKTRSLRCIADMISNAGTLDETIYHEIIEGEHRMTNQLLALCRVPFMEIRVGAMAVVSIIASKIWGQKELASHPNFFKWIIDRSSEACKEGKEAKFEILKALVESGTASRVFKGEDYLKLRADFKNGPFHVGIAEEMMMDNQQAS